MTDTPKPPMVVWVGGHRTGFLATTTEQSDMTPDGPYVHLDQFLAEVRNKAIDMAEKDAEAMGRDLPAPIEDCMTFWLEDAMQELAKKIKEGKA